jgi:hypothetical protein
VHQFAALSRHYGCTHPGLTVAQSDGLLQQLGYRLFASVEHDNGRLATVRMMRAFEGIDVVVDLLFASSGIEAEVAQAAEELEITPGLTLPVARIGHLIALKVLAREDVTRPQDLADLRALLAVADTDDLTLARQSVALVEARGFQRGRYLARAKVKVKATPRKLLGRWAGGPASFRNLRSGARNLRCRRTGGHSPAALDGRRFSVTYPRRPKDPRPRNLLPSTYRRLAIRAGVHQHDTFDPSVKQFQRAMRPSEPTFDDAEIGARWRAARRTAMEHILAIASSSPWSAHLVVRGSILLRAWLGDHARDPGDIDWVVTPLTMMLDDRRTADMLDGLVAAVRARPAAANVTIAAEVAAEDIWTYERAPGRRLMFTWSTPDAPDGTVQCDFAFNERLPLPPAPTTVLRLDGGDPVTVLAAGPALSLAWKILWLETDYYPQGKDLYDAALLAERTYLPLDLLREVLSKELGADAERFTADQVLGWQVDWDNFQLEYPWVRGNAADWQVRLHQAIQGTFGAPAIDGANNHRPSGRISP